MNDGLLSIIGVVIGAVISLVAVEIRDRRIDRRQSDSTRLLLSIEIDDNLAALAAWWNIVTCVRENSSRPTDDPHWVYKFTERMTQRPGPNWQQLMWTSQAHRLALALTELQIRAVHTIYAGLNAIDEYRGQLMAARQADLNAEASAPEMRIGLGWQTTRVPVPQTFGPIGKAIWPELARTVKTILEQGNPLKS